MPINGTVTTVLSSIDDKGKGKMSAITSAIANAGQEAKKSDPKNGKKAKK